MAEEPIAMIHVAIPVKLVERLFAVRLEPGEGGAEAELLELRGHICAALHRLTSPDEAKMEAEEETVPSDPQRPSPTF